MANMANMANMAMKGQGKMDGENKKSTYHTLAGRSFSYKLGICHFFSQLPNSLSDSRSGRPPKGENVKGRNTLKFLDQIPRVILLANVTVFF